jgi:hypothetical protein
LRLRPFPLRFIACLSHQHKEAVLKFLRRVQDKAKIDEEAQFTRE